MGEEAGQGQGSSQAQGAEGTDGGDEFDKDRALATIKAQRESETKLKGELSSTKAEMKALQDQIAEWKAKEQAEADEKLSEQEKTAKRIAELEQRLADTETQGRSRVAKAALKAAAAAAQALYPDDVPSLVGSDAVKFDKDGNPTNADELVSALKETRPALFQGGRPGSGDGGPRGTAPGGKPGMEQLLRSAAGR